MNPDEVRAHTVEVTDDELRVRLIDGRGISVPLAWFPRLLHGSAGDRSNFRLLGGGVGIHWPALDEDLSVEGLLKGTKPPKKQTSISGASRR